MLRVVCLSILWIGLVGIGSAQSAVDAAGGSAKSPSYSFSYAVGEAATLSLRQSSGLYFGTGGVIQPDPVLVIGVEDKDRHPLILYPNPGSTVLHLAREYSGPLTYAIYSLDGNKRSAGAVVKNEIDIRLLPAGLYFLKLIDGPVGLEKTIQFIKI
jgi:hypothetical protein